MELDQLIVVSISCRALKPRSHHHDLDDLRMPSMCEVDTLILSLWHVCYQSKKVTLKENFSEPSIRAQYIKNIHILITDNAICTVGTVKLILHSFYVAFSF